jgi:hypothetical protein
MCATRRGQFKATSGKARRSKSGYPTLIRKRRRNSKTEAVTGAFLPCARRRYTRQTAIGLSGPLYYFGGLVSLRQNVPQIEQCPLATGSRARCDGKIRRSRGIEQGDVCGAVRAGDRIGELKPQPQSHTSDCIASRSNRMWTLSEALGAPRHLPHASRSCSRGRRVEKPRPSHWLLRPALGPATQRGSHAAGALHSFASHASPRSRRTRRARQAAVRP